MHMRSILFLELYSKTRDLMGFLVNVYYIPCSRLQQDYQTLYHHSFRVADYVPLASGETGKMKFLVEACSGIGVRLHTRPLLSDRQLERCVWW